MGKFLKQEARLTEWVKKLVESNPSQMMGKWYDTNQLHRWFCRDYKDQINSYYEDKRDRNKRIGMIIFLGPKDSLSSSSWPNARQSIRNPVANLGHATKTEEQEVLPTVQTDPARSKNNNLEQQQQTSKSSNLFPYVSYWDSDNAKECFGRVAEDPNCVISIEQVVIDRINKMREVYSTHKGWETIVKNKQSVTSPPHHEIFKIQLMCRYVATALDIALSSMHLYDMIWSECCRNAVNKLGVQNIQVEREIVSERTIQRWHHKFHSCFIIAAKILYLSLTVTLNFERVSYPSPDLICQPSIYRQSMNSFILKLYPIY